MTTDNPVEPLNQVRVSGRPLAFIAGLIFLSGTCGILFEDVLLHAAPLALKHFTTCVVLAGTMMTGHLANEARRNRHWLAMLGFGLVCLCGTCLVVYSSTGRQAGEAIQTTAQIDETNGRRSDILAARARDQRRLDNAADDVKSACRGGDGKNCKGAKATVEVYKAAIKGHDADLSSLGPTRVSAPEAEQFADVLGVVFEMDKAKVKAAAVLAVPFIVTLFLEFGTIVSFGYAFRHTREKPSKQAPGGRETIPVAANDGGQSDFNAVSEFELAKVAALFRGDIEPDGPNGGNVIRPKRFTREEVRADLTSRIERGEAWPSQRALASQFGIPTTTLHDWLRVWAAEGNAIPRQQIGRRKAVG